MYVLIPSTFQNICNQLKYMYNITIYIKESIIRPTIFIFISYRVPSLKTFIFTDSRQYYQPVY